MIYLKSYLRISKRSVAEKVLTLEQETVGSILVLFTDYLCGWEMLDHESAVNCKNEGRQMVSD